MNASDLAETTMDQASADLRDPIRSGDCGGDRDVDIFMRE